MSFCFSCFVSKLENVINLPDSTEPETCIHLKREDKEEMRIVGVPKSKGLNGCQEVRGFSDFQVSAMLQLTHTLAGLS